MGKRWEQKRKNDHFYKKAKEEGYRSRAAYKLKQLDEKYNILQNSDTVLDLGSAPGGWLQVAREKVGEEGFVLGIDLEEIEKFQYSNIRTITADITEPETINLIQKNLPKSPNVILSDASPNISGVWDVDHARSIELGRTCLSIAEKSFQTKGNILIKVFQGEFFTDLLNEAKQKFDFCKSSKPEASRDESAEIYIVGKNFKK